jgi:Protein of unknown function (DUF2971)
MPANNQATHPPPLQAALNQYEAWQNDYSKRQDTASTITEPLYHYTDARGLRGIFESQQLWFTDYRHLNDPSEFRHGLKIVRDIAGSLKQNAGDIKQFFLDQFIEILKPETFDKGEKGFEFYIASFSRDPNDLGQWRAYADNGRGFAIGFAPRMFEIVEKPPTGKPAEQIGIVTYTREEANALQTPPIEKAAEVFLTAAATNAGLVEKLEIDHPFMMGMIHRLMGTVTSGSLRTKHLAYKHEQEVRLIIPGPAAMLSSYVKTRLRGSEIVPYIPQPWEARVPGNVAKIMIGPAAVLDTERTLRKFLRTLGMEFDDISGSDIPYRAL